jgi:hypothetical protein
MLDVSIKKQLGRFALDVSFEAGRRDGRFTWRLRLREKLYP